MWIWEYKTIKSIGLKRLVYSLTETIEPLVKLKD